MQTAAGVFSSALALLEIVAVVAWLSALATLGALVAPQVFRHVSAPTSADVMARIFRNYDSVALSCGALALLCELLLAWLRTEFSRLDAVRIVLLTLLVGAGAGQAWLVTPRITKLSVQARVQALAQSPEGKVATLAELQQIHAHAGLLGKAQAAAAACVVVLAFARVRRRTESAGLSD